MVSMFSFQSFNKVPVPVAAKIEKFNQFMLQQPDHISCGPTSATMVLHYYNKNVSLAEVTKLTYTEWIKFQSGKNFGMTAPDSIRQALHRSGVPASVRRGNIYELKKYISEGKPVIVLLRSGKETWHYCVAIEYDEKNIVLANPSDGQRFAMTHQQFINSWRFTHDMYGNDCGYTCLVCSGTGKYHGIIQCDACAGKGTLDPLVLALRVAEIYSNTMIVPK